MKHNSLLLILLIAFSILLTAQIAHASSDTGPTGNQWALSLQVEKNGQITTDNFFSPFDQIALCANVTYGNASQPNVLVAFKAQDPSNTLNITDIETTNITGQAELSFRIPTEDPDNGTIVGTWQATATIQTTNGPLQQSLTFTSQWSMEITSITLQNSQGQNQTSFTPGNIIRVNLAINNNGQAQTANFTLNMQDAQGNILNQTQIQNKQIGSSNPTQVQTDLQIPSNTSAGQAQISAAMFAGEYQGTNLPAAENKTASFTITSSKTTTTPKPQISQITISLFSWLLVATGIFTFTSLTVFLRRKPYSSNDQTPKLSTVQVQTAFAPAIIDSSQLAVPTNATVEILAQQAGLQSLAEQLSDMSSTTKRIEALQAALKVEREQLAREMADVNKTVEEQEKAVKQYFEAVRQQTEKMRSYLNDQEQGKTENSGNQSNKSEEEN